MDEKAYSRRGYRCQKQAANTGCGEKPQPFLYIDTGACPAADISGQKRKEHARPDAGKAQKIVRKTR